MSDSMKMWLSVGGILAVTVAALIFFVNHQSTAAPVTQTGTPAPITSADHVTGTASSTITLIEYGDFQCPICGEYFPIMKQIEQNFGTKIAIVYRYFPLSQIHPNAFLAAEAAEAAGNQGKFWEMHDELYIKQKEWSSKPNADAKALFIGYASSLGLSVDKFGADLTSSANAEKIMASYNAALALGIPGTPTFFINDKEIVSPRSYAEFAQVLTAALGQ